MTRQNFNNGFYIPALRDKLQEKLNLVMAVSHDAICIIQYYHTEIKEIIYESVSLREVVGYLLHRVDRP